MATVIADCGYPGTGASPEGLAGKTLRDRRLEGEGAHRAVLGIARLHNLALRG